MLRDEIELYERLTGKDKYIKKAIHKAILMVVLVQIGEVIKNETYN